MQTFCVRIPYYEMQKVYLVVQILCYAGVNVNFGKIGHKNDKLVLDMVSLTCYNIFISQAIKETEMKYQIINSTRDNGRHIISEHNTKHEALRELYKGIEIMKGYYRSFGWVFDAYHFFKNDLTIQQLYIVRNGKQVKINDIDKRG